MWFSNLWHKTMENKWISTILNLVLLGMFMSLCLLLYWGFRPYNIVEYNIDNLEMTKDVYTVGEPLTYRTSFCKKGDYGATQIRTLHDGVIYIFPPIESKSKEGCHDFISTSTPTPNVPSGTYTFEIEAVYHPNPLRELSYHISSQEFSIVNDD